ncbi:asparagine synthetase domain-containing protein 1 isoform X1 [Panulirus ornatus]|uniref:asparagine synthetase domain-containing protein 1 isoform X1 n=1 Tax=Panulirus ornatus TaxID=150431 RepID=UPI003A8A2793
MCGICFICGSLVPPQQLEDQICSDHTLLCHRGPDVYGKKVVSISDKVTAVFEGCVLWLQGIEPTTQPVTDEYGNILLWNGDILAGFEIPENESDTKYISDNLATKGEAAILSFLGTIKGPWSLIYYQKEKKRLYFGRDVFGRHSLLWHLPSTVQGIFMVSSVCRQRENIKEIPAFGLYFIDFTTVSLEEFKVNLIPWSNVAEESLMSLEPVIKIQKQKMVSSIQHALNMTLPSDSLLLHLKSLPSSFDMEVIDKLYLSMKDDIKKLLEVLTNSVQRRIDKCPPKCLSCTNSPLKCDHSRIAVLFSGGLDSAMIALLIDSCLPESESVDLLNVAFMQRVSQNVKTSNISGEKNISKSETNPLVNYEVPDRISGKQCWQKLQEIRPHRKWNFVEINVTADELAKERESVICHLVAPLTSVLDDSIGCALWFGGRGRGIVMGVPYISPARVLLCGMGADEQLGGYSRHRRCFAEGGWSSLLNEINMEISRIHTRNLGRDNRILADHGRAPRFPYLDEDVVSTLNSFPIWIKANLYLPRGIGEKFLLRVAAAHLGLSTSAALPKRAIQFGSRIAKLENSKEKGSDSCVRLIRK